LSSIPDWIVFFVPWVVAAATNLAASVHASKRYRKGRVISMKLKVSLKTWWASARAHQLDRDRLGEGHLDTLGAMLETCG
jgi:hypothetical protein